MAATIITFILNLFNLLGKSNGSYTIYFCGWHATYGDSILDLYEQADELRLTRRQAKWLAKQVSHYLTVGVANWDEATNVVNFANDGRWITEFRVGGTTTPYAVERRGVCGAMTHGYPRCAVVGIRRAS